MGGEGGAVGKNRTILIYSLLSSSVCFAKTKRKLSTVLLIRKAKFTHNDPNSLKEESDFSLHSNIPHCCHPVTPPQVSK